MKEIRLTSKVSSGDLNRCLILKVQETFGEDGGVAQLGEHLLCKQGVIGSIPFISTTRKGKGKNGRETPLTKMGS